MGTVLRRKKANNLFLEKNVFLICADKTLSRSSLKSFFNRKYFFYFRYIINPKKSKWVSFLNCSFLNHVSSGTAFKIDY